MSAESASQAAGVDVGQRGQGVPANQLFRMRHAWNDGGVTAAIDASERNLELLAAAAGPPPLLTHATMWVESYLVGPRTNVAWIETQFACTGATSLRPSHSIMVVDEFRRLTVQA